jgi:membrane associated rhomboid family serine protease
MSSPLRRDMTYSFGGPLTPAVKYLIIANVAAFVLQKIAPVFTREWFALYPPAVKESFLVWQLATYLFMHGGLLHLGFNMLALFLFGCELERMWRTPYFFRFYFACGIGAGLFALLPVPWFENAYHVGASGAIYGLLMAYGLYFPNRVIYMNVLLIFFFPIQVKYFVAIIGIIAFLGSVAATGEGVSHIGHLGGLVVGYLYLRLGLGRIQLRFGLRDAYRRWRMKRLRKKFEQYYQKRSGGGGPQYTVH